MVGTQCDLLPARFQPRSAKTSAAGPESRGELPNWGRQAVGIFVVGTAEIDLAGRRAPSCVILREARQSRRDNARPACKEQARTHTKDPVANREKGRCARTLFTGSGSRVQKRHGSEA